MTFYVCLSCLLGQSLSKCFYFKQNRFKMSNFGPSFNSLIQSYSLFKCWASLMRLFFIYHLFIICLWYFLQTYIIFNCIGIYLLLMARSISRTYMIWRPIKIQYNLVRYKGTYNIYFMEAPLVHLHENWLFYRYRSCIIFINPLSSNNSGNLQVNHYNSL